MKSVKSKLFLGYCLTILIVLLILSFGSLYIFKRNQELKSIKLLESTYIQVENFVIKDKLHTIKNIDNFKNIEDMLIFIYENNKIIYSNKSLSKTKKMESTVQFKIKKNDTDEDYVEYYEVRDYIISYKEISNNNNKYKIYVGIDEHVLSRFIHDMYLLVLFFNIVLYFVLLILGYFLINKAIKPLKVILDDVKKLKSDKDLSKRLKKQNTNDEFEELCVTFNSMLSWIEDSVDNIKQFSSDASHELRTPLTVIQGEIEHFKNSKNSKEEVDCILNRINIEQKKLQNIINDFLLLSKLDKEIFTLEKVSLDKVIFETIEANLSKIEEKRLVLDLEIEDNLIIDFNEKYLYIVLNNLIINAIKYTNEGYIKIEAKKHNKKIFFKIEDSGIGIDKKDLNDIFKRFYRVDKVRKSSSDGLGLGLSIVKKLCDKFNYDIQVKSELLQGTTFIVKKRN